MKPTNETGVTDSPEDIARGSLQQHGWAAWRCPWCGWSNNRNHEGLDACEKCGSETKTQYPPLDDERLIVKIAYEPEWRPNAKLTDGGSVGTDYK